MNESQKLRDILIRTPFTLNVVAQLVSNWPSSSPTSSIYNRIRGCWTLAPTEAIRPISRPRNSVCSWSESIREMIGPVTILTSIT